MQESRIRRARWAGLAILTLGPGCTHNYYYGVGPNCPPMATQVGGVCEVPAATVVGSTGTPAVASTPTANGTVVVPNTRQVVISQPAYGQAIGTKIRQWRRTDPEGLAASNTKVEGALESPAGSTIK